MPSDVYFDVQGVATVRWDATLHLVYVEWAGWANSAEFAALLDAEVRALSENGGSHLLADCRLQRVLSPIDQDKADREWLPRALAAGLRRFAIVLPTSALAAKNLEDRLGRVSATALEIAYFETIDEARTWITR
jgi:hypothetical protein